jgi:GAF domain-containing protein
VAEVISLEQATAMRAAVQEAMPVDLLVFPLVQAAEAIKAVLEVMDGQELLSPEEVELLVTLATAAMVALTTAQNLLTHKVVQAAAALAALCRAVVVSEF